MNVYIWCEHVVCVSVSMCAYVCGGVMCVSVHVCVSMQVGVYVVRVCMIVHVCGVSV